MNGVPELHIRVSSALTRDGQSERHAFSDLSGQLAVPVCGTHTALTEQLGPDDPNVRMCPLCNVFVMVRDLNVSDLGDDWKAQ